MTRNVFAAALLSSTLVAAHQHSEHDPLALATDPLGVEVPIAPVLDGIGDHHHPVTTRSEKAQRFFDQGLKLTFAFNHQEALRAMRCKKLNHFVHPDYLRL